jgi:sterol desaturase/sphingolipid hydroxylase (fatty acid hydroxylase superfamily)
MCAGLESRTRNELPVREEILAAKTHQCGAHAVFRPRLLHCFGSDHGLMHNSFLWRTHAPHHHITQLNALKGLVGNPLELFLVSLSVLALFDLSTNAIFCAFNLLVAVSAFAHANVRFDPPRWYAYVFTTVEAHSLHHAVGFKETRCNYANALILCDRMFGTFRKGEAAVVGQDERTRLPIRQQFMFPLRPLIALIKAKPGKSAPAAN